MKYEFNAPYAITEEEKDNIIEAVKVAPELTHTAEGIGLAYKLLSTKDFLSFMEYWHSMEYKITHAFVHEIEGEQCLVIVTDSLFERAITWWEL